MKQTIPKALLEFVIRRILVEGTREEDFEATVKKYSHDAYAAGREVGYQEWKHSKSLKNKIEVRRQLGSIEYQSKHPAILQILTPLHYVLNAFGYPAEVIARTQQKILTRFVLGYAEGIKKANKDIGPTKMPG